MDTPGPWAHPGGRRAPALVAMLVLPACLGSPSPSDPRSSAAGPAPAPDRTPREIVSLDPTRLDGRVVFAHEGDVWVMDADGTGRTRLTNDPGEDFDPVWSPDGRRVAFRSHRDGNEEVYVMNADGSEQRNLSRSPTSDYSPAWSPDGTRIAFATDRDPDSGGNDIYVVDASGRGKPARVTTGGGIDEYPSWSPDGARLAFACTGGRILPEGVGDFEICMVNLSTGRIQQITDAPGISDHPAWAPDGKRIAFMSTRGGWPTLPGYVPAGYEETRFGDYDVYVMDTNGSNVRNVTRNGREDEQYPAWSPDGRHLIFTRYGCLVVSSPDGNGAVRLTPPDRCADGFPDWTVEESPACRQWIAFTDERHGRVDLYQVRSDGTGLRRLTRDRAAEQYPTWSPEGEWIVFERRVGDAADIWILRVRTGERRRLTRNPGLDWSPAWAPDGRSIAFASIRGGAPLSLYTMTPSGSEVRRIPHTEGGAHPAWAPDGRRLAFRKELPGNDEILVIDADGTDAVNLTEHPANDYSPDWAPEGDRVVFESIRDGNYELYSVSDDGSHLQRLTNAPGSDQFPSWSPYGDDVLFSRLGELHLLDAGSGEVRPLAQGRPVTGNFASWGPCLSPTQAENAIGAHPG